MKVYFEDDHAVVKHDEARKLVEVSWKITDSNSSKYRFTLTKALAVFKQFDIKIWVSNMKNIQNVSDQDKQWVKEVLIPNIASQSLDKAVFVVKKESTFEINEISAIAKSNGVNINFFDTIEEAYQWLENN
jgi:hypothetical protein